jgi:hypothetical protein
MSSSTSIYGGSEDFSITHALRIMDDNIKAIEDINTNGPFSPLISQPQTQENTNAAMDRFVTSLEAMLLWTDPDPNIAAYSGNKSTYTDAITLGKAYITENT